MGGIQREISDTDEDDVVVVAAAAEVGRRGVVRWTPNGDASSLVIGAVFVCARRARVDDVSRRGLDACVSSEFFSFLFACVCGCRRVVTIEGGAYSSPGGEGKEKRESSTFVVVHAHARAQDWRVGVLSPGVVRLASSPCRLERLAE